MNEQELNEIEERAAKATPGPWFHNKSGSIIYPVQGDTNGHQLIQASNSYYDPGWSIDADFIANARTDVPDLLAEVERLTAENARLRAMAQDTCTWTEDGDNDNDVWDTECGEAVVFDEGTPKEHGYRHCHYCGKNIIFALNGKGGEG